MVGFDDGIEMNRSLNGSAVPTINADLTGSIDLTQRKRLRENAKLAFMATVKVGPFELSAETAQEISGHRSTRTAVPIAMSFAHG